MKTTRPVFESFSAFVSNLYEMESQYPGFLDSLNEEWIEKSLMGGKSVDLQDILQRFQTVGSQDRNRSKEAALFLQGCASLNPVIETKLKEIGKVLKDLGAKSWIAPESIFYGGEVGLSGDDPFFSPGEQDYLFGNGDVVQVQGAPAEDCSTIVKDPQYLSYRDLCGRVAAYNATICATAFQTTLNDIDKKGEVKRAVKGEVKVSIFKKIFSLGLMKDINFDSATLEDCLFLYCQETNEVISCIKVIDLPSEIKSDNLTIPEKARSNSGYGQFKYLFPVVSFKGSGGKTLSVKSRQELVKVDKSKETVQFDDQINITSDAKTNYYGDNVADLSESGKTAIIGIINQFAKIDKITVLGSADKRPPKGWKNNTELATARRDKTIEFINGLAKKDGLSITGVKAEAGKVEVQPADGSDDPKELQTWRAVKLLVTGEIYKDINDALGKGEDEFVTVTYTDVKKSTKLTFNNSVYSLKLNTSALRTKEDIANFMEKKK